MSAQYIISKISKNVGPNHKFGTHKDLWNAVYVPL